MPLNIRSEEVNQLAEKLARHRQINKTEAVKVALENDLRKFDEKLTLWERIKPIRDRVMGAPATGLEADKAFYDSLNDEEAD